MKRGLSHLVAAGALLVVGSTALLQPAAGPPRRFGLRIPEEGSESFEGNQIALTRESVASLVIDILNPTAEEIERDRIYPWINGEAASTISELRRTRAGLAVVLDLELKPHLRLVPGQNTVEIVAENHRGRRFYQNWVVRVRERSHHEWFTFEFVDGLGEENPAPPVVEILSPLVPPVLQAGRQSVSFSVRARIAGYNPLAEVHLDGIAQAEVAGKLEVNIEGRLTLRRSRREVVIQATDIRGNETRVRIPIVVAASKPPPRLSGERYLLSIGISRHDSEDLPLLPGAADDAERLGQLLVQRAGFKRDAVFLLKDRGATLAKVRSALRDFVSLPGPDDLLILYMAGYGVHGYGSDANRTYLACADTRLDQLRATGLDLTELARLLEDPERVRSRNVLLLFEIRDLSGAAPPLVANNLVNARLLRLFSADRGRTVLVSAEVGQRSRSKDAEDGGVQGLFSAALISGLSGQADWNRDRVLTVAELFDFVSANVKAESGGEQVPSYRIVDRSTGLVRLPGL